MANATVSFSLDKATKDGIDLLARKSKKSRSDVVREMFAHYRLEQAMHALETEAKPILRKLDIDSEDDLADYVRKS